MSSLVPILSLRSIPCISEDLASERSLTQEVPGLFHVTLTDMFNFVHLLTVSVTLQIHLKPFVSMKRLSLGNVSIWKAY